MCPGRTAPASTASVGDDQVCRHAREKARGDQVEAERVMAVAAHAGPDLTDHMRDRAAGEGLEQQLQRTGVDLVADDRAEERGPAADQAGAAEPGPGWPRAAERAADAEALARVVPPEADDQHGGQADRAGLRRDTDREPLGEVVQ